MNSFNKTIISTCVICASLFSINASADPDPVYASTIMTTYPAGTSFKQIVMSGKSMQCTKNTKWQTEWNLKNDILLPASVTVKGDIYDVTSKIYLSFFDHQEKMTDPTWRNIQIRSTGCTVSVTDKAKHLL